MRPDDDALGPAVLIGSRPAEGPAALAQLGVPFIWVVDPDEAPPVAADGAIDIVQVPFRSDPLSVFRIPLPDPVCAVFSFTEFGSLPAALLSEALRLPTVPVAAVVRTRNKLLMRRALANARVDTLPFGIIGRDDPAPEDFPLIAKPVEGAGSKGIQFLPDLAGYRERITDLTGLLWERYVTGPEFSVEAVSDADGHHILGITAKTTTGRPHFVETGHQTPAVLSPADAEAIRGCAVRCLDALGISLGASHTEVKLENGLAVVIETHTRAGGDRIPLLTRLVSGLDQYELAIRSALPWVRPSAHSPRYSHAAVHYFPWQDVTVEEVTGLDECRALDGVVEAEVELSGGHVPTWRYSHERPGHLVVGADSPEELGRRITAADATVHVNLRDTTP